jgi:hypothetical protein
MKKTNNQNEKDKDIDTMRPEYDFSNAIRGITSARYNEGKNIVVIAPDIFDLFPDSESVNEALRALATVIRHRCEASVKV